MNIFTAKVLGLTINLTSTGGYTFNPEIQGQMIDFLPEEAEPVVIYIMDTKKEAEAFVEGMRAAGVDPSMCCASSMSEPFEGFHAVIRQIEQIEEYTHDLIDSNNFEDGDIPVIDMTNKKWVIYSPNEAAAGGGFGGFWNNKDGWVNEESATLFSSLKKLVFPMPKSTDNNAHWVKMR